MESNNETAAVYDFIHPDHQLQTQWPVLLQIHEQLEHAFTDKLSKQLNLSIAGVGSEVGPRKYKEFIDSLGSTAIVQEVSLAPLAGNVWLCVDASIVSALVDIYFGGNGEIKEMDQLRKLTATELKVLGYLTDAMLEGLQECWSGVQAISAQVESIVPMARLTRVKEGMVVLDAPISFSLANATATCRVVYPFSTLEPLSERLSRDERLKAVRNGGFSSALRREVFACDVELRGILSETEMTVRKLLDLKTGDFIPLRDVENVVFKADQVPLFNAQIGKSNGCVSASFSQWHRRVES
ncbi:MAG: FliM/FliN family flagellar motor switch protein [Granulosicoccus sp.]